MGLRLFSETAGPPWPVPIIVEMTCDGEHGLFRPEPHRFPCPTVVYRAGWKETSGAGGEKCWLGPCCSGKVPQ